MLQEIKYNNGQLEYGPASCCILGCRYSIKGSFILSLENGVAFVIILFSTSPIKHWTVNAGVYRTVTVHIFLGI